MTQESITCLHCGKTSYHPEDIRRRYCGNCNEFHSALIEPTFSRDLRLVDLLSILADSLLEGQVVEFERRGHWTLMAIAFPKGVRKHYRQPCEACGGHKRRLKSQFWVRWFNDSETLQGVACIACSFPCAVWLASRINFPPDSYRS